MTWWCVARDIPWTWRWQAYPGVWLFVLAIAAGYWAALTRWRGREVAPGERRVSPRQLALFTLGLLAVWLAADWPIGALGAGYLASVHTVQFCLFTLVAPPLLLLGTPRWLFRLAAAQPGFRRLARAAAFPPAALAAFALVLVATHLPPVVDVFKRSQLGSFAFDVSWLGAGLVTWWPAVLPLPELRALSYPVRIGHLALTAVVSIAPSAFLTFARYPLYATYELAPRVGRISAANDQQAAGLIMHTGGGLIIIAAMTVLFFSWYREEEPAERAARRATT